MSDIISINRARIEKEVKTGTQRIYNSDEELAECIAQEIIQHIDNTNDIVIDPKRVDKILAQLNYSIKSKL